MSVDVQAIKAWIRENQESFDQLVAEHASSLSITAWCKARPDGVTQLVAAIKGGNPPSVPTSLLHDSSPNKATPASVRRRISHLVYGSARGQPLVPLKEEDRVQQQAQREARGAGGAAQRGVTPGDKDNNSVNENDDKAAITSSHSTAVLDRVTQLVCTLDPGEVVHRMTRDVQQLLRCEQVLLFRSLPDETGLGLVSSVIDKGEGVNGRITTGIAHAAATAHRHIVLNDNPHKVGVHCPCVGVRLCVPVHVLV